MASRGRGRGRGGFGGGRGYRAAKQVPFELFPEIPELGNATSVKKDENLTKLNNKLRIYWNSSPYYYEDQDEGSRKSQCAEIERFSDRFSERRKPKPPLSHFIKMDPAYIPAELVKGDKKEQRGSKRVRWNPDSDMQKLDIFEKLEQKYQGQDGKEKKEDADEEEVDEKVEEEEEEYSTDGDYNQNIDFDDDEDDFNMADDNDDEPMF